MPPSELVEEPTKTAVGEPGLSRMRIYTPQFCLEKLLGSELMNSIVGGVGLSRRAGIPRANLTLVEVRSPFKASYEGMSVGISGTTLGLFMISHMNLWSSLGRATSDAMLDHDADDG